MKELFFSIVMLTTLSQLIALPTKEEADNAVVAIYNIIENKRTTVKQTKKAEALKKLGPNGQDRPMIGGFLRLAFHDCLGEGGCDGCIDFDHPSNKGLDEPAGFLNEVYDANDGFGMSRADFYALAAWTAVEQAPLRRKQKSFVTIEKENGLEFKFGREDCENSPNETPDDNDSDDYPSSCFNMEQSVEFFEKKFGFTADETVAAMGAHTLGFIRHGLPNNQAAEWVTGGGCSSRMNNKIFFQMLGGRVDVGPKDGDNGLCFWKRANGAFLDSDMSLAYEFTRNEDGSVTCGDHTFEPNERRPDLQKYCAEAAGMKKINEYKADNDKFVSDFAKVFDKILNRGSDGLKAVENVKSALDIRHENWVANKKGKRRRRKGDAPTRNKNIVINDMLDDIEEEIADLRDDLN